MLWTYWVQLPGAGMPTIDPLVSVVFPEFLLFEQVCMTPEFDKPVPLR